jgi:hypothetical protein
LAVYSECRRWLLLPVLPRCITRVAGGFLLFLGHLRLDRGGSCGGFGGSGFGLGGLGGFDLGCARGALFSGGGILGGASGFAPGERFLIDRRLGGELGQSLLAGRLRPRSALLKKGLLVRGHRLDRSFVSARPGWRSGRSLSRQSRARPRPSCAVVPGPFS